MADTKFSALAALTGANVAVGDRFVLIDISAGVAKTITEAELAIMLATLGIRSVFFSAAGVIQIGGTSSSFPALKQDGFGQLEVRSADDTYYAPIITTNFEVNNSAASLRKASLRSTSLQLADDLPIAWSDSASASGTKDVGLIREVAGELRVTDGGAGTGNAKLAGLRTAVVTKTANYTATAADQVILVDATAGAVTITLPAIAAGNRGKEYRIKKVDSSINVVTIARTGSDTIDGATTSLLATQFLARDFVAPDAGVDWAAF